MPKIFDEEALREDIVKVWGEYGAHVEVFDFLVKKAKERDQDENTSAERR
jgi:hypothetical protein